MNVLGRKLSKEKGKEVKIKERRLMIVSHNSWTAVNGKGFGNYVVLMKNEDKGVLEFDGEFELDGIVNDELMFVVF